MIVITRPDIFGWEMAIKGARNPMNSWDKSDSGFWDHSYDSGMGFGINCYHMLNGTKIELPCEDDEVIEGTLHVIGPNDQKLLMNLCKGGTEESKWRRMIHVQMDIIAPLYWWKEFDTYKIGTVSNSCSTMHKIHSKEFTLEDFSCEKLCYTLVEYLKETIGVLNFYREVYNSFDKKSLDPNWYKSFVEDYGLQTKKDVWWQMIQLLPSSYNQRRTIDLNYEVLAKQYRERKNHKLDEWRAYCNWIESLPYSEFIIGEDCVE